MKKAIELGKAWKCDALIVASSRPLSIIYEEHLAKPEEAIECLRHATAIVGVHPQLQEQEANALFHRRDYNRALELWQICLRPDGDFTRSSIREPYALRKAAIAAGHLQFFAQASEWFEQTAACAAAIQLEATAAGAHFDAAFCSFKAREWAKSIAFALEGLERLQNEYDPSEQFAHFATRKLGGQILLWMMGQVRDDYQSLSTPEPVLGQCTNPDKHSGIADLAASPYELSMVMLLEIASRVGVSNPKLDAARARLALSTSPTVAFQYWSLRCYECVAANEPDRLAEGLLGLQRSRWLTAAQTRVGGSTLHACSEIPNETDRQARVGGGAAFLLVLFLLALTDRRGSIAMATWRSDLDATDDGNLLKNELESVSKHFSVDATTAQAVFHAEGSAHIAKLCAAARLLLEQRRSPAQTWLWLIAMLTWLWQSDAQVILSASLKSLAKVAAKLCRPHLDTPALLNVPRTSVPQLRRAIESNAGGAAQLLMIMEAVEIASGITLPGLLRKGLRSAAQTERDCAPPRQQEESS